MKNLCLKSFFCLLIVMSFIMCGASGDIYIDCTLSIKVDGKRNEKAWDKSTHFYYNMRDVDNSQDKYAVISFLADEQNLYIYLFVMDDGRFSLNGIVDGAEFSITENGYTSTVYIDANAKKNGSSCSYSVATDRNAYEMEISIPFSNKIISQSNLKVALKIYDNYVLDGEFCEVFEDVIYINLDFEPGHVEETTLIDISKTSSKSTTTKRSNSSSSSKKTTTKKNISNSSEYTLPEQETSENIGDETINEVSHQTLIFNDESSNANNTDTTKIFGIIIAGVLVLVGVFLIMKFK